VTTGNHKHAGFEASMRLPWAGSALIVLAVAFFVLGLVELRADLVYVGAIAGAVAGLGVLLAKVAFLRQRNMHPY
jgi:hypothetical protein